MGERQRWLLSEAGKWRREGKIDETFLTELRQRYGGEDEEAGFLQRVLFVLGGVILFLAIFFLVSQFWDELSDLTKFYLLVGVSGTCYAAGILLESLNRFRALAAIALSVGGGALFLSFVHVTDTSGFAPYEVLVVVFAFLVALLALGFGYLREPALAAVGALMLFLSFLLVGEFTPLTQMGENGMVTSLLAAGLVHAAINLGLWTRPTWLPAVVRPLPAGVRLGGTINALFLIPAIIGFVEVVIEPDSSWPGIILVATYGLALLALGIASRFRELLVVGGVVIVGDAVWLGEDQGGLIGTIIALVAAAALLIGLAQSGLLKRWFATGTKTARNRRRNGDA